MTEYQRFVFKSQLSELNTMLSSMLVSNEQEYADESNYDEYYGSLIAIQCVKDYITLILKTEGKL